MKGTTLVYLVLGVLVAGSRASAQTVFSADFESGVPVELAAPGASTQSVQGYAGLGAPENQFGGNFLRYDSTSVVDTTLTLGSLPPHDSLSLGFLLGVIDSWDGTELLEVLVDGATLFSHTFQLATGDSSSYVDSPGALLSSGTGLGFSAGSYYSRDRAYDLSVDPAFVAIPHTADAVTIVWRLVAAPGGGASFWQGGVDESWAFDNVRVAVQGGPVSTTTTVTSSTTTVTEASSTSTTTVASSTTTTTLAAQLLSGKKLLLKTSVLDFLAKDPTLTLGAGPESAADPTLHGGSLRVYAAGGDGFDDTYALPAAQWRHASKKKPESGYKFGKGDPITAVLVKAGKQVKIHGKGAALGHSLAADPRPVLVELRLGAERYCFAFGGTVTFTAGKKYLAKSTPAAAACPP